MNSGSTVIDSLDKLTEEIKKLYPQLEEMNKQLNDIKTNTGVKP